MANNNDLECIVTIRGREAEIKPKSEIRGGYTTSYVEVTIGSCKTNEVLIQLLEYYGEERLIELIKAIN